MKLNTTIKAILAAVLLLAFMAVIIQYVNPMIENHYALRQIKAP